MFFVLLNILLVYASSVIHTDNVDVWNDQKFLFIWTIDTEAKTITIDIDAKTSGWVGVAFSSTGAYTGSDMWVGYIDPSGEPHISDYFVSNGKPTLDTTLGGVNNIKEDFGSATKGYTHLHFVRDFDTGDKFDVPIEMGKPLSVMFMLSEGGAPTSDSDIMPATMQASKTLILYPSNLGQ
jgi:hypothetical protein